MQFIDSKFSSHFHMIPHNIVKTIINNFAIKFIEIQFLIYKGSISQ